MGSKYTPGHQFLDIWIDQINSVMERLMDCAYGADTPMDRIDPGLASAGEFPVDRPNIRSC